jgi:RNA polymerase sigma-70 factor (ECF subfamily)
MAPPKHQDFTAFYEATWGRTVACAYAISGELGAAEDAAQDAYARAWPRWSRLREYDDPGAWVRQVATRQAISRWRRSRTALNHLVRSREPATSPAPDESTVALVAALRTLPEAQRRAIVLHHVAGLPVTEVARVERCPEGTVKARLSRGRAALADQLGDSPPAPGSPSGSTDDQEPSHA